MTNPAASFLYDTMVQLYPWNKPSSWCEPLKGCSGCLSRHWLGTYAYFDHEDLDKLRTISASKKPLRDYDMIFIDLMVDEGKAQVSASLNHPETKDTENATKHRARLCSRRTA